MSRWWVSASLSALPLIHHLSQVFGNVIAYPGRKIPIEPETLSALCNQKAAHVLGIFIAFIHDRHARQFCAVPVNVHPFASSNTW
ncbi:hypothetical protein KR94_12375 [Pantoea ananatis]|nr:hypothetical protein KR94_12375 [Pantoea ananatis]